MKRDIKEQFLVANSTNYKYATKIYYAGEDEIAAYKRLKKEQAQNKKVVMVRANVYWTKLLKHDIIEKFDVLERIV